MADRAGFQVTVVVDQGRATVDRIPRPAAAVVGTHRVGVAAVTSAEEEVDIPAVAAVEAIPAAVATPAVAAAIPDTTRTSCCK
jgi:hypothetical protein